MKESFHGIAVTVYLLWHRKRNAIKLKLPVMHMTCDISSELDILSAIIYLEETTQDIVSIHGNL